MGKTDVSLAIAVLVLLALPAGLSAQRKIAVLGGTGGGVHGFAGFEHELGRVFLGDVFLRESLGGSYLGGKVVISPDLLFGWQLLDLDFLRFDANMAAGAHIVPGTIFSFLPYASAGAELSSYFFFVGYEFAAAFPDLGAPDPRFLHQISAGLRFGIGPAQRKTPAVGSKVGKGKLVPQPPGSGPPAKTASKVVPKQKDLVITFTSPKVKAGQKYITSGATFVISGQISDPASVKEVTVNGVKAKVTAKGAFSATVRLAMGQNTVMVTAIDKSNKKYNISIVIVRQK